MEKTDLVNEDSNEVSESSVEAADVNNERRERAIATIAQVSESYEGLIPHPTHFREFEEIHPGSAKWFLDAATEERQHRHEMDRIAAKHAGRISILTAVLGWTIIMGLLATAIFFAFVGLNVPAYIVSSITIITVSLFAAPTVVSFFKRTFEKDLQSLSNVDEVSDEEKDR